MTFLVAIEYNRSNGNVYTHTVNRKGISGIIDGVKMRLPRDRNTAHIVTEYPKWRLFRIKMSIRTTVGKVFEEFAFSVSSGGEKHKE